jgi:hypothetical protein
VIGTRSEDAVNEQSKVNRGPDRRGSHRIAAYTAQPVEHGPKP